MDFNFTEEQEMVRDGLSRLVREQYGAETRREVIASETGWRPEIWAQLAELGILGMPFSEEDGGFGGGAIDSMIVMEEFGKGLVVEPFVPTVVCAGGFLNGRSASCHAASLLGEPGARTRFSAALTGTISRFTVDPARGFVRAAPRLFRLTSAGEFSRRSRHASR